MKSPKEKLKTINISESVHKLLKIYVAKNGSDITTVADKAIISEIKNSKVISKVL